MKRSLTFERRTCVLLALACLVFALPAAAFAAAPQRGGNAQNRPNVTAQLSTGIVKLGQEVRVSIVAENVQSATIDALPKVDGLRFGPPSGPVQQISQMFDGFRRVQSQSLTWSVPVLAERKGDFRIPALSLTVDGEKRTTAELSFKVVEDLQGEELGLFEIDAPDQVAEGQPFTLELRFGWDAALDSRLNYANLSLPWLGALAGVVELDLPPVEQRSSITLNLNSRDRVTAEKIADRTEKGRTFHVLRLKKRYLATRAGKLSIPTSHLEFGTVDDSGGFFGLRRTSEKETYYKRFPAFDIEVIQLPENGRPLDFSGAVGKVYASAHADRRDVDAGESIKLTVEWTGDANLEFFEPPDLGRSDAFRGFRVYGTTDKKAYERRAVTYDLAPISPDVREIPPVPLRIYDPAQKAYTTVVTSPIPIQVRALKDANGLGAEAGAPQAVLDIRDIHPHPATASAHAPLGGWAPLSALGGVLGGWLLLRTWVRKNGDPDAPRARARRAARKRLVRELGAAQTASAQTAALHAFLGARSGESASAWLGRDALAWSRELEGRLADDDARALAQLTARLDERTWGGSDQALDGAEILRVADRVLKGGL